MNKQRKKERTKSNPLLSQLQSGIIGQKKSTAAVDLQHLKVEVAD